MAEPNQVATQSKKNKKKVKKEGAAEADTGAKGDPFSALAGLGNQADLFSKIEQMMKLDTPINYEKFEQLQTIIGEEIRSIRELVHAVQNEDFSSIPDEEKKGIYL